MVMALPLLLCLLLTVIFPFLSKTFPALDFFEYVIDGLLIGISLALLIPLMGSRRRETFSRLYFIPAILLLITIVYQYLHMKGIWQVAALGILASAGPMTVLLESAFLGFLTFVAVRSMR